MSEQQEEVIEDQPTTEPHGEEELKEKDWKSESRKWEARAKANKDAAEKLKQLEESQMTELEKAQAERDEAKAERDEAKAERDRLKAEKERSAAIKAAAKEAEVDPELLELMAGDTPEQIVANASVLKEKIATLPVYPSVEDKGATGKPVITKEEIENIKNPVERVKKRAEHPELYK